MKAIQISQAVLVKEIVPGKNLSLAIGVVSFAVLTALGAFVRIPLPFTPVPITLQTFFVLLAGAILGRRWGAVSQLSYLFLGGWGLPIFSGARSGLAALFGPTGGYLFGFVAASWLIGRLVYRYKNLRPLEILLVMSSGLAVIYLLGCLWLAVLLQLDLYRTLALGLWPFLPGACLKLSLAAIIYNKLQNRAKEVFG